jgi:hypothetical protein
MRFAEMIAGGPTGAAPVDGPYVSTTMALDAGVCATAKVVA